MLVRNCAPTLAGIKTGNMFSCPFEDEQKLRACVRGLNLSLREKGLRVIPLRYKNGNALIYVYRPAFLTRDLMDRDASRILKRFGYGDASADTCVSKLKKRLDESEEFPHEIGLFLGYPPEDVNGFMYNRGGCKYSGLWKVYGDVEKAKNLFSKYKRCTASYCALHKMGKSIDCLAVIG